MQLIYRGIPYSSEAAVVSNSPQQVITTQYRGIKSQVTIAKSPITSAPYALSYRGAIYIGHS